MGNKMWRGDSKDGSKIRLYLYNYFNNEPLPEEIRLIVRSCIEYFFKGNKRQKEFVYLNCIYFTNFISIKNLPFDKLSKRSYYRYREQLNKMLKEKLKNIKE